jgi:hypothetical protein
MSEYEMGWQAGQAHAEEEASRNVEAALAADREAALRDVFAAAALGALVMRGRTPADAADGSYNYADAMMETRKKKV